MSAAKGAARRVARHSGLQKSVLSLYRECLRAVAAKPEHTREALLEYCSSQFRTHASLPRKDINKIEYLIRQGKKQMTTMSKAGSGGVRVVRR